MEATLICCVSGTLATLVILPVSLTAPQYSHAEAPYLATVGNDSLFTIHKEFTLKRL